MTVHVANVLTDVKDHLLGEASDPNHQEEESTLPVRTTVTTETPEDEIETSTTAEDQEVQPIETVVVIGNEKEIVTTDATTETAVMSVTTVNAKNVPMAKTENHAKVL